MSGNDSSSRPKVTTTLLRDKDGKVVPENIPVGAEYIMAADSKTRLKVLGRQDASNLLRCKKHLYTNMTQYCKYVFVDLKHDSIGGFFLPPYDDCPMEFLLEIFEKNKDVLVSADVGHVEIPRLPELCVKTLQEQAFADPYINKFLPSKKPKRCMNRDWLFTVSYFTPPINIDSNQTKIIAKVKPTFFPAVLQQAKHERRHEAAKERKVVLIREDLYEAMMHSAMDRGRKFPFLVTYIIAPAKRNLKLSTADSKKRRRDDMEEMKEGEQAAAQAEPPKKKRKVYQLKGSLEEHSA